MTAAAVDAGSSVIAQIRTLGQIDDNMERGHQVLNACVDIERIILKIAGEWEKIESRWMQEKEAVPKAVTTIEEELTVGYGFTTEKKLFCLMTVIFCALGNAFHLQEFFVSIFYDIPERSCI